MTSPKHNDAVVCRPWTGVREPFRGVVAAVTPGVDTDWYTIHPDEHDGVRYVAREDELALA